MANELRGGSASGLTAFARILNSDGLWWNGTTFVAYVQADYEDYAVTMTEQGASGIYVADMPAALTLAGTYEYFVYSQQGGSPAESDPFISTGRVDWTGTAAAETVSGAMTGEAFRDYIVDSKGFVRDDKDAMIYDAITDAIQAMRRRFSFDEAQAEATNTDTIDTLGDYRFEVESDLGMIMGITLEDDENAEPLIRISKAQFDALYPDAAVTSDRGYPKHYCIFAGQVHIGPVPDSVDYAYRQSYSRKAGVVTSSTVTVPFTAQYRDILAEKVLELLYTALEEYDKADRHAGRFEVGFRDAKTKERHNQGLGTFVVRPGF